MKRKEYTQNEIFSYVEYTPEKMTENLPIIFFLHGAGERGNGQDELSRVDVHGFSKYLASHEVNAIFILPQCPENIIWITQTESMIKFIEEKIEYYKADKSRVYLTGLSMGGFGTWFCAMAKPKLFAAIVPVCGGAIPWNASVIDCPVWIFHGALDETVNCLYSDEMYEALKMHNKIVKYTRLENVGHNAWDYTYDAELIAWLLNQKRD